MGNYIYQILRWSFLSAVLFGETYAILHMDHKEHSTPSLPQSWLLHTSQHGSMLTRTSSRKRTRANIAHGSARLLSGDSGVIFLTEMRFGNQTCEVVVDTGSSDTWVISTGFTCLNQTTQATIEESNCLFGQPQSLNSSFQVIPDENFNALYGSGGSLSGTLGYISVKVADITVPRQEIAMVDHAAWQGDGISSGLLGLALPSLTSAYPGTNVSTDNSTTNRMHYPSIMQNIFVTDEITRAVFSFAISRDESNSTNGGIFTIGGVPHITDPAVNASTNYATTPFEKLVHQFVDPNTPEYQYYVVNGSIPEYANASTAEQQFLVDTGTSLIYVTTDVAARYNSLWDPPAYRFANNDLYFVNCTATPPPFSIKISNHTLMINPIDLNVDIGGGLCGSGIQDAGNLPGTPSILGDVFFKNVLAVFDYTGHEMHFAARPYYKS